MANFNYLMHYSKPMLVKQVLDTVQQECGKLMYSQWHKLFKRLNRENKIVLQNLIIQNIKNNDFMADCIKQQINFNINNL